MQVISACLPRANSLSSICSCSAFEVDLGAGAWNSTQYRPGACHDRSSVLCTVYSPPPPQHCFIWTFLTRIALNYARRGAVWQPLKMKYLLVFSQAQDQRLRALTCSHTGAPSSSPYLQRFGCFLPFLLKLSRFDVNIRRATWCCVVKHASAGLARPTAAQVEASPCLPSEPAL